MSGGPGGSGRRSNVGILGTLGIERLRASGFPEIGGVSTSGALGRPGDFGNSGDGAIGAAGQAEAGSGNLGIRRLKNSGRPAALGRLGRRGFREI